MGWAIGGLVFLLYLGTLSHHYSADSVLFALRIEGGQLGQIVDPTHLLVEPLGLAWYRLWHLAGWNDGPLVPSQVINALAGALSVALLYLTAQGVTGSRKTAGTVSAGFAISGAMWLLSTEAESATIGLASSLLVLWLLLAAPPGVAGRRGYEALLGVAVSLALLTYLSGALLVPVVVVGLLLRGSGSKRQRGPSVARFLVVVAAICLPVAGALLVYRSWPEWSLGSWQDGGTGYTTLYWFDVPHGVYAFLRSLGLFPGQALNESARAMLNEAGNALRAIFVAYYGLLAAVALAPIYWAIRRRQQIAVRWRWQAIVLSLWAAGYAAFAIYWVPGDITFWLPVLAAWWLLVALVVELWDSVPSSQHVQARRWFRQPARVLAVLVVMLAVGNAFMLILPRRDLASNGAYQLAMEVRGRTSADDLIVTQPNDISTLYLVYFGRRVVLPATTAAPDADSLRRQFLDLFMATSAAGGRTFLLQDNELQLLKP